MTRIILKKPQLEWSLLSSVWILRKDIAKWIGDNNIKVKSGKFFLDFENIDDAMRFKLIWG
jgi:hypothetical protein